MEVLNEFCYDLRENGRQKHRPLPTWSEIKPGHGEIFVGQQLQHYFGCYKSTIITIHNIKQFSVSFSHEHIIFFCQNFLHILLCFCYLESFELCCLLFKRLYVSTLGFRINKQVVY